MYLQFPFKNRGLIFTPKTLIDCHMAVWRGVGYGGGRAVSACWEADPRFLCYSFELLLLYLAFWEGYWVWRVPNLKKIKIRYVYSKYTLRPVISLSI